MRERQLDPKRADVAAGASPIIPDLPILRTRQEGEQRATFLELFFDLVYVYELYDDHVADLLEQVVSHVEHVRLGLARRQQTAETATA